MGYRRWQKEWKRRATLSKNGRGLAFLAILPDEYWPFDCAENGYYIYDRSLYSDHSPSMVEITIE